MTLDEQQYYPYKRVQAYGSLPNVEKIPCLIRDYLMDLPQGDYEPIDDNRLWRVQLMKYLYYDGVRPLDNPLPGVQEKLQLVYDPEKPSNPPGEKGYRIFTQVLTPNAQTDGVTTMRIVMSRLYPTDNYISQVGIQIYFMTNANYEASAKTRDAMSRTFTMACLAVRALNGLNIGAGVGTLYFSRSGDTDCNIYPISDEQMNVGYRLTMALTVEGTNVHDQ